MALPTRGRVIVDTTAGEIDIELWSKVRKDMPTSGTSVHTSRQETPKTCRNFVQLAMEGRSRALCTLAVSYRLPRVLRRRHFPPVGPMTLWHTSERFIRMQDSPQFPRSDWR